MTNSELIQRFDSLLAPYGVPNAGDHGRQHAEDEHPDKLPFQRDRDRIIHCKAFRRLKHKTQVIVSPKGDHYRDRLTHSLEGAQIARSLCRSLKLNEDLAEAAILAHDLGHPPFGHEGEFVLDQLLKPLGFGFDHNEQGYRIVTQLEINYPDFPGLNLTAETLAALQKHETPWEKPGAKIPHNSSIEAQVVNLADEIAYYSHDVDDGLRAGLISVEQLKQLEISSRVLVALEENYPEIEASDPAFQHQISRHLVHILITDIIDHTRRNIEEKKIENLQDVYSSALPIADYPETTENQVLELRKFLFEHFYESEPIRKFTNEGKELLAELFNRLYENPKLLPEKTREFIDNPNPLPIVIKDYVAGMTDNFARETVIRLRGSLI